jgi:hypothetical protein
MNRRYANRVIEASGIVEKWGPIDPNQRTNPRCAPLAGLEPEPQRVVWEQAVEECGGEQPTAARVKNSPSAGRRASGAA